MAAGTHPNIWRKRHVLAPWIIQIGVGLAALILSARALSIRVPDERSLT